jgi:hypothetical protein
MANRKTYRSISVSCADQCLIPCLPRWDIQSSFPTTALSELHVRRRNFRYILGGISRWFLIRSVTKVSSKVSSICDHLAFFLHRMRRPHERGAHLFTGALEIENFAGMAIWLKTKFNDPHQVHPQNRNKQKPHRPLRRQNHPLWVMHYHLPRAKPRKYRSFCFPVPWTVTVQTGSITAITAMIDLLVFFLKPVRQLLQSLAAI